MFSKKNFAAISIGNVNYAKFSGGVNGLVRFDNEKKGY
jgi:hypothetical protein